MSNVLIINGAKEFAHSKGQLNDTLTEVADGFLRDAGHDVKVVRADGDYDVKTEVQNFLWADVVIWQMPGWWMGAPWTVKKYMDDVFTEGHGSLYASDGRTRSDASKKYGSGGLIQGKKYLSLTMSLKCLTCRVISQNIASIWRKFLLNWKPVIRRKHHAYHYC